MVIKTLVISIILVTIIMLGLAVKLLFKKNAEFIRHSCSLENEDSLEKEEACTNCELKEIIDCKEKKDIK